MDSFGAVVVCSGMEKSRPKPSLPKSPKPPSPDAGETLPYGDDLENAEVYVDLRLGDRALGGADGVSFKQLLLERIDWREVLLRRPDFTDVALVNCDLSNSRWEHVGAERLMFEACRLTGFVLLGAKLKEVLFKDCQARFAQMEKAVLKKARFESCAFPEANFNGADLNGAVFAGCDVHNATFAGANLLGADFRGSNIEASRVAVTDLKGAIISARQAMVLLERYSGVEIRAEED